MKHNFLFKIISILFHPIFIPLLTTLIFFTIFSDMLDFEEQKLIIYLILLGTFILPLLTILILLKSKVIKSIYLNNKRERIIPLFATGVYVFATVKLIMVNYAGILINSYLIGVVITLSWILIFSRKHKVSIHTASIGATVGFFIYISYYYLINLSTLIALLIFIAGLISTSRIKLKVHDKKEIYLGLLFGIAPQISFLFLD